jgi:predicted metal-dependent hydrolase
MRAPISEAARKAATAAQTVATRQTMSQQHPAQHPIVPRERLDFNLNDKDIPKYWFGGDPFKTRLFDAMSVIFPPGERFFMVSVRDFRDRITDPKLLDEIKGFNRLRALYAWHAIEEVEHKGVAYDVMRDHAKVGYAKRIAAMLHTSVMFPVTIHCLCDQMLKMDGFSWLERRKMHLKGLWWVLKPGGLIAPMVKHYFPCYRFNFHPWQEADQPGYEQWVHAFNLHRNPIEASELMRAALAR